jgi:hypothetical protein
VGNLETDVLREELESSNERPAKRARLGEDNGADGGGRSPGGFALNEKARGPRSEMTTIADIALSDAVVTVDGGEGTALDSSRLDSDLLGHATAIPSSDSRSKSEGANTANVGAAGKRSRDDIDGRDTMGFGSAVDVMGDGADSEPLLSRSAAKRPKLSDPKEASLGGPGGEIPDGISEAMLYTMPE